MRLSIGLLLCLICGGGAFACSSPEYALSLSNSSLTFTADWDEPSEAQSIEVEFEGDGLVVGRPLDIPAPSWLSTALTSPTVGNRATLTILAVTLGLPPGTYETTLRFATGKADGSATLYKDLPIALIINDSFKVTVADDKKTIGGTVGSNRISDVPTISVAKYGRWTARSEQPWLELSSSDGAGRGSLTAKAVPSSLPAGRHQATVTISSADGLRSMFVELNLELDKLRWWTDKPAMAFTTTGNLQRLSGRVSLASNGALSTLGLAAQSDAAWLTASVVDEQVVMAADPALAVEGLHFGTVTLTSSADTETPSQRIRVSLYKSSAVVASQQTVTVLARGDVGAFNMLPDPLRPVVYVGSERHPDLEGYDVFTGARVFSVPSPSQQALWNITPDGRYLLTRQYSTSTAQWGNTITPYDLNEGRWLAAYQAKTSEAAPKWIVNGVTLSRTDRFVDSDGASYAELGGFGTNIAPGTQQFADPRGRYWWVLQPHPPRYVTLSMFDVQVFKLARKIAYYGGFSASYEKEGLMPPAAAPWRTLDTYPPFSNGGLAIWVAGGIYAGRLLLDPRYGFFPVRFLNYPTGGAPPVQALSVNDSGEAMAIWPGVNGSVAARYGADGALLGSESFSADAPALAPSSSLSAMLKHSADGLRVVSIRRGVSGPLPTNVIGLMSR